MAIMSPPRRPKGEKPRTTIRFLQRQIANLQSSCNVYHGMIQDRDKQIARQDVELSEAANSSRDTTMPKLKLSPEAVRDIKAHIRLARRLAKKAGRKILPVGMAGRLASKHGVSSRTIQHLITGDRWREKRTRTSSR